MRRGYVMAEGRIGGSVEMRISSEEMKDWPAEDITAFFAALAEAKRIVERNQKREAGAESECC